MSQRLPSPIRVLNQQAQRVREAHLLDRPAVRIEETRRTDEVRQALGARDRDVEAVAAEEELDVARDLGAARGRHREEDDRRLLSLELVDGADPDPHVGDSLPQAPDVRVVRRDDHHVPLLERPLTMLVHVGRPEKQLELAGDRLRLLGRRLPVALVLDRQEPEPVPERE